MGKGYNNYMCKKPFHPGSKANIKRAWMAEQKTENEKRKQDDLKVQYEKEQDLYNNRALISSESKDKLQLNFMYEAPPGAKRERQKEDDEPEYRFEWQRKYNAPREDYAKGNEDIKDQPFGIPVRNVRCIKCHKWGHINTDKECPLYNQASTSSMPTTSMDPMELMRQMKEDGYGLKENVLGHQLNPAAANQQFIASDESDPEIDFLKSLSTAEKKKLLRKLKKLSKKQKKSARCKKKKSKKHKKSESKDTSSSESEEDIKVKKKKKTKKSSSSESESSRDESTKKKSKKSKHSESKISSINDEKIRFLNSKEINNFQESETTPKKKSQPHSPDKPRDKSNRKPEFNDKTDSKCARDSSKLDSMRQKSKSMEVSANLSKEKQSKDDTSQKATNEKMPRHLSSSSDNEKEKIVLDVKNSKKTRHNDDSSPSVKKRKYEAYASEDNHSKSEKGGNFSHPDGFSHLYPQALIAENYLQMQDEYEGKIHDKFRHLNRDKRSPSVKQKYNN